MGRTIPIAATVATICVVLAAGEANRSGKDRAVREEKSNRTLDVFYSRRAYPGAPPVIPHALLEDRSAGGKNCLACHANGGYVPHLKAYTPVTPHPDWANCRQCHVPQKESAGFRNTSWQKSTAPAINQEVLRGGPPPTPHEMQTRTNCVACHAGPGAVVEIRTPHPERSNCQQCHVPVTASAPSFRRGDSQ